MHPNHASVTRARLEELERKERAHDAYMEAMKATKAKAEWVHAFHSPHFAHGYMVALRDFAEEIIKADLRLNPPPRPLKVASPATA